MSVFIAVISLFSLMILMMVLGALGDRFPDLFERLLGWISPLEERDGDRHV